jgi:hypothetical protein
MPFNEASAVSLSIEYRVSFSCLQSKHFGAVDLQRFSSLIAPVFCDKMGTGLVGRESGFFICAV